MFQKIQQLIDDKDALVFVLIDEVNDPQNELQFIFFSNLLELVLLLLSLLLLKVFFGGQVESLTAARNACQAGTEPSDAIRVVNSVLTQLDQIKRLVSKVCCMCMQ